jgi:hypothetical protein
MPKELTHWLLATRIYEGLPDQGRLKTAIGGNLPAYLLGAVLPDTLLHLFRGPHSSTARALSHAFHDSVGNSFAPLIHAEDTYPEGLPPAMLACFLGVITHMETDIVFHPLVYALTGSGGIGRHYRIETDIDRCFLDSGTLSAISHVADLIGSDTHDTVIEACARIFDPERTLPQAALKDSLALHGHIQGMYDSTFWKLAARILAIVKGAPFRDQQHLFYPIFPWARAPFTPDGSIEWKHPVTGKQQHCSLMNLADRVVEKTIDLFGQIGETGSLARTLGSRPAENMLTGLPGISLDASLGEVRNISKINRRGNSVWR